MGEPNEADQLRWERDHARRTIESLTTQLAAKHKHLTKHMKRADDAERRLGILLDLIGKTTTDDEEDK